MARVLIGPDGEESAPESTLQQDIERAIYEACRKHEIMPIQFILILDQTSGSRRNLEVIETDDIPPWIWNGMMDFAQAGCIGAEVEE
jgi:hypothetical protein